MELREIKKLADALNESGKLELVYFLQSRMEPLLAGRGRIRKLNWMRLSAVIYPSQTYFALIHGGHYTALLEG